jgi:hypothetical protein
MNVDLGIRITNPLNSSWGRWQVQAGQRKAQRAKFAAAVSSHDAPLAVRTITFVRYAPSRGMDGDGLQAAMKTLRDAACEWLGVDDSDRAGLAFSYEQYNQPEYGVRVRFA